jgi:CRP-like cAMP-binding protein
MRIKSGTSLSQRDVDGIVVIRSGLLISYANTINGASCVFALFSSGVALFGDEAFDLEFAVNSRLTTLIDTEVCIIPMAGFKLALRRNPDLMSEVVRAMRNSEFAALKHAWIMQGISVDSRVRRYFSMVLFSCGKGTDFLRIPLTQESLAMIVRAERATVARVLKTMSEAGLVTRSRRMIVLKTSKWLPDRIPADDVWDETIFTRAC